MSAALSLVSPENPEEWINWHRSEWRLFLCQRGRGKRHAVTKGLSAALMSCWWVKVFLWFTSVKSWTTDKNCSHSLPSHHLYPPLPIIARLLSIHLFVRILFPSCLLIGVVPHHLFLHRAYRSAPWANVFQQHLKALVGRPPACSKNSYTPSTTCGPVQPNRGFHYVDDGEQSSFLSPHKSVGGHVL